jgi:hypothetical protein
VAILVPLLVRRAYREKVTNNLVASTVKLVAANSFAAHSLKVGHRLSEDGLVALT